MIAVTGDQTHTTEVLEKVEYGQLWSDGTFNAIHSVDEEMARRRFSQNLYGLAGIPKALHPVFASRRVVTTIESYTPEPVEGKS